MKLWMVVRAVSLGLALNLATLVITLPADTLSLDSQRPPLSNTDDTVFESMLSVRVQ